MVTVSALILVVIIKVLLLIGKDLVCIAKK